MGEKSNKYTSIGGQAVIEGVMMRGPKDIAVAVRVPDGSITVNKKPVSSPSKKYKILKVPILRGVMAFFESMIIGVKALMYSAEFFEVEEEEEKPSKFDKFLEKLFGDKLQDVLIYFSVFLALCFGIALFILFPTVVVGFIKKLTENYIVSNIVEGIIRIVIFIGYIVLISKMKDIKRIFEYHGAEHKTIYCYEHKEELTPQNAKKYSTLHPRCGTSFLIIVMIVSIIVFSFIKSQNMWLKVGFRLLLLPVVAGISYEIIKWAGKSDNIIVRIISIPGLLLQKLTTKEPDEQQLEVAIEALKNVLTNDDKDVIV